MLSTAYICKVCEAFCYTSRETVMKDTTEIAKPHPSKIKLSSPFYTYYDTITSWNHIPLEQSACRWDLQGIALAISIMSLNPV